VNSGGSLYIRGTATAIRENGGSVYVGADAVVTFLPHVFSGAVLDHADATVHSGTTALSATMTNCDMRIFSAGVANSTTVNSGGVIFVSSGGSASNTTVNCLLYVRSGGIADVSIVNSGGEICVSSGGTANSTTVNSAGRFYIYSGGIVNSVTVNSGGMIFVSSGVALRGIDVSDGGYGEIRGEVTLVAGNTVNDVRIFGDYDYTAGVMNISSGGVANLIVASGWGADIYVHEGGIANVATIKGGSLLTHADGVANYTLVESKGNVHVFGEANDTTVGEDGTLCVWGVANSNFVNYKGSLVVQDQGRANSNIVYNGGSMYVSSGGTATAIQECGGNVDIADGAKATFLPGVFSGAVLFHDATVHSGTTALSATVSKCSMLIFSDGSADSTTISNGGFLMVSGGVANNNTVLWQLHVSSGGEATANTVESAGGLFVYDGGAGNSTTVNSRGSMFVYSGGMAASATVSYGGSIYISSGGTLTDIRESGGYVDVAKGAKATFLPGVFSGAVLYYNSATVHSGTTANSALINANGCLYVSSGGTADSTTVKTNGYLYVYSGGMAKSTTLSGGVIGIYKGGSVCGVAVRGAGQLSVESGGKLDSTTLYDGGKITVSSGGTAGNTNINGVGSVTVSEGGKITGALRFTSGAVVSAYLGSILDFDISGLSPNNEVQIYDLSLIQGMPDYTITISDSQRSGVYNLAGGVTGFYKSITVKNVYGDSLGVLAAGETLNGVYGSYSLSVGNNRLMISVVANEIAAVTEITADVSAVTNKNVTITAKFNEKTKTPQYSLDNKTWQSYKDGVVMSNNGTVYFRGLNAAGAASPVKSYVVTNIDKVAPAKPTAKADITAATNQKVTVTATFSSDSDQKQYSTDNKTWKTYTTGIVMSANGTVYFRGIDSAGNVSDVTSYAVSNITTSAPAKPTATADITAATNKNVTVTATFSGNIVTKQYSTDNKTWKTYTTGIVMSANGTVYFRGIDAAGNVSDVTSYAVTNIDKVAPTKPSVKADVTSQTTGKVTVTATFSADSAQKQFSLDNKTWQTYTSSVVFSKNGTVYFRGIDAAGNVSNVTSYAVSNITAATPESKLSGSGSVAPGTEAAFTPKLAASGLYTLGGTFGANKGTATVLDKTGKKVASGSIKNGIVTFKKDLLLDSTNTYKVVIKNTDKSGTSSNYSVELKAKELFSKGDNSDDTKTKAKTLAAGASTNDWVGYGDAADYYKLGVAAAGGIYSLNISGVRNNVKLTVYSKDGRKVKSVTASAKKPSIPLADLCLDNGSYAVVQAPKAAKAQNSDYTLKLTERATFKWSNNDWSHAEVLKSGATFTGALTKAAGGDTVDYCDISALGNLSFTTTAGKVKVSFYNANKQAVKVAAVTMANGTGKANVASLTLAAGNATTGHFTIGMLTDAVKFLKIEAAGKTLNSYTIGKIA